MDIIYRARKENFGRAAKAEVVHGPLCLAHVMDSFQHDCRHLLQIHLVESSGQTQHRWTNTRQNSFKVGVSGASGKRLLQVCKKPVETGRVVENLTGTLHLCRVINNLKQS